MSSLSDLIGMAGVVLLLTTYGLLQTGRLCHDNPRYSLFNAAGASAILFSLSFDFNLSAFVIEGSWLAISLYGLARTVRRRSSS